jgi:two-component sensor histidine kinase
MIVILCLVILFGCIFLRHELRHRQDKALLEERVRERTAELEHALSEKSVLLQEIHHRVNNNLQIITSILQLEADRTADPALQASKGKTLKRVYAMALVHELLYQTEELEHIDLGLYAGRLIDNFRAGSAVEFGLAAEREIRVGLDFALPFGLLLNELLSNAREHAFPPGRYGRVDVRLKTEEGGAIGLSVSDDGVGMPEGTAFERARSLGFTLVNTLALQLHGKIELEREGGTRWVIVFPKMEPRSWRAPQPIASPLPDPAGP